MWWGGRGGGGAQELPAPLRGSSSTSSCTSLQGSAGWAAGLAAGLPPRLGALAAPTRAAPPPPAPRALAAPRVLPCPPHPCSSGSSAPGSSSRSSRGMEASSTSCCPLGTPAPSCPPAGEGGAQAGGGSTSGAGCGGRGWCPGLAGPPAAPRQRARGAAPAPAQGWGRTLGPQQLHGGADVLVGRQRGGAGVLLHSVSWRRHGWEMGRLQSVANETQNEQTSGAPPRPVLAPEAREGQGTRSEAWA